MPIKIDDLRDLRDTDLQRAVLETFVVLFEADQRFNGWTHVRFERRHTACWWFLLDADPDCVRREQQITMGDDANRALFNLTQPFVDEQQWEVCRVTVRFSPPRMTVDVLTDTNAVVLSGELIDLHLEEQVRNQLALMMEKK